MSEIDTLLFDLGGVLVDLDRLAAVRAYRELGFPQAEELLDPYLPSGIFLRMERGEASVAELHDHVRAVAGERATAEGIDAALNEFLVGVSPYKLDMLLALRGRYRVCLLSNTNPIAFPYAVRRWFSCGGHTLDDYFDECFLSYELGAVKPDPEIFRRVIARGVVPPNTLFIDDGEANIRQAAQMGFHTRLFVPGEDLSAIFG